MLRTARPLSLLALLSGVVLMQASAPAMAGGGFTFSFTPNKKEAAALSRGISLYSAIKSKRNTASVKQTGVGNGAGVSQSGSGNAAGIFQVGNRNSSTVTQTGNNNTFGILQLGNNRTSNVTQTGNGLSRFIVQGGW